MAKLSEEAQRIAADWDARRAKTKDENLRLTKINRDVAPPGTWYLSYEEGVAHRVWKSSIVGGDELSPGGTYILQRTPAKSPEGFVIGKEYIALRATSGEFSGEVVDQDFHTFQVDANDLFTTY